MKNQELPIVKKLINLKNHKIQSFDGLETESDLIEYCQRNDLVKQHEEPVSNPESAVIIEIYSKSSSSEESTTIIIDINNKLIGYNNGEKGKI